MNEIVTVTLSVQLDYEFEAGRKHLIRWLKENVVVQMAGFGDDDGEYSMKSINGSVVVAQVPEQNHDSPTVEQEP